MPLKNIDLFFEGNPNPMWIYDPGNLRLLEVNDAALQLYGYDRNEMLSLTLKDLRPPEEIPELINEVNKRKQEFNNAGIWKHWEKDGTVLYVRILSTPVQYDGKNGKLVVARDLTEQEEVRKKLSKEKELLDTLTDNIPGTFFIFDKEGRPVRWNKNLEKITGYSSEEVRERNLVDYFDSEVQARVGKAIKQAYKTGGVELEASLCTKEGEKIPFYFSASRIEMKNRPHLLGVGIDISKQKAAQQEVKKQRKLLQAVMEQSGAGIFVKDVDGPYRLVNEKFKKIFKTGDREIIGHTDRDLFGDEDAEALIEADKKVLKSGEAVEFEEVVPTREGERYYFTVKYPLKNIQGYEQSICGIASDITKLKKVEKELDKLYKQEKKERHQVELINRRLSLLSQLNTMFLEKDTIGDALEHASELIVHELADLCTFDIISRNGDNRLQRIVTRHRDKHQQGIAEQLHEKFPDILYGPAILKQVLEERKQIFIDDIDETIRRSNTDNPKLLDLLDRFEADSLLIKPLLVKEREVGTMTLMLAGEQKDIVTSDSLLLDELAYKIALAVDNMIVHEYMKELNETLEQRVKERTHQLEEANKELESFSYSVSHDLRSPLRAIDGYTSLLLEDYHDELDGEGQEFLTIVNSEAKRMGVLIDDLLSFSRLNQMKKRIKPFPMKKLVMECIEEVRQAYPETNPDFFVEELPEVETDPRLIRQVWVNLLGNAVKYRHPNRTPKVRIGVEILQNEEQYVFSVGDNGVGFNMKYADKLFGVFQRLHSDEEFEGTGIGLALVRRIINRHGGDTWAESEVGEGTTIRFSLPMISEPSKN